MEFTTCLGLHSQATRLQGEVVPDTATIPQAWHLLRTVAPFKRDLDRPRNAWENRPSYTQHFPPALQDWGIMRWAPPRSLAVTRGILVSFFSSAY
jgi:hypothetical protein